MNYRISVPCLLIVTLTLLLFSQEAFGQAASCQEELNQAEQAYTLGSFDQTITLVDACLNKANISETERRLAFRLKGLSYIGKGLEVDAREAVKRLLELVPSFNADPIQDPPAFVEMIEEVRKGLATQNNAQPLAVAQPQNTPDHVVNYERNRVETWYTNWGLGFPVIQYPDALQTILDQLEGLGLDNASVMLDLLGFYWPVSEQTMIGTSLNAWGDIYSGQGESFQVTAFTLGASTMHFLQNRIGEGVFLRADIGGARLVVDSSLGDQTSSEWGFGFLIGGGYGIPVSRETRILLHLNYSLRKVESENYGNVSLGVSGLF